MLVVDNYDSFVYNLVQYLGELGAEPIVHRNDALDGAEAQALEPDAVLLSPGPGRPEDAGNLLELIDAFAGRCPVLGVCLGHQAIGQAFGGAVVRAPELMHGKTSFVEHARRRACSPGCPTRSRPPATTRWWWRATACPTCSR